jgi:hypothetical protein
MIKFEVNKVIYNGSTPNVTVKPEDIDIEPSQLTLDGNGAGNVKISSSIKPVEATIMAMLMNSDETDILSCNTCMVNLTQQHNNLFHSLSANPVGVNEEATITASIVDDIYNVWPPAPNVTVTFRISKDGVLLSTQTATTGNDGKCNITFTPAEIGMYDIEANFEDDDGTYETTGASLDVGDYKIWLHARYFGEWIDEYISDGKWALTYITRGTQWYDYGIIYGVDLDCKVYLQTNSLGELFIEDQEVNFSKVQSSTSDNRIQITSENIEPASAKTDSSGYCHAFYTASAIGLYGCNHTGTSIWWRATANTKSGKVASITINNRDDIIECNNKKLFIEESVR